MLDRLDIVLKEQDDDREKLDSFEDDSFDEEYVDEDVWDVEKWEEVEQDLLLFTEDKEDFELQLKVLFDDIEDEEESEILFTPQDRVELVLKEIQDNDDKLELDEEDVLELVGWLLLVLSTTGVITGELMEQYRRKEVQDEVDEEEQLVVGEEQLDEEDELE